MPPYTRQRLLELQSQLGRGRWIVGGRKRKFDHFWLPNDTMSLCHQTIGKGSGSKGKRCHKCLTICDRIREAKPLSRKQVPSVSDLRRAVTDLVDSMRVWMKREAADPAVMVQALWLVNLAGVANSGVHRKVSAKVLRLMREVAMGRVDPNHALELMKGWETNG